MPSIDNFSHIYNCKPADLKIEPADAVRPITCLDGDAVKGTIYYQAQWFVKPFTQAEMIKHDSDKLMIFLGGDKDNHEDLGADIELWLENDKLTLPETCVVFVPKGVAHGRMTVKNVRKPFVYYFCLMNSSYYDESPAEASAPEGKYTGNIVVKYEPVDREPHPAPEGSLSRLVWIDGAKLEGAPYLEALWYHMTNGEGGPETHIHDFDELIGFMGGDAANPKELHGTVSIFLDGETVTFDKSCVMYIPRGMTHSPIKILHLDDSIIHFSGGNGGSYVKTE